jgi:hypothetical protein
MGGKGGFSTHCPKWGAVMTYLRPKIQHLCRAQVQRSVGHSIALCNLFGNFIRYIELFKLLAQIIQSFGTLFLPRNLLFGDLNVK